ncbi:MAG: gamma-butyrobetaine hydroxylase-like domain-containing protein, partial [Streptosporangiaceae bacterium]
MAEHGDGPPERQARSGGRRSEDRSENRSDNRSEDRSEDRSENTGRPPAGADDSLLGLPAIWLRDNCACAECRDPGSRERLTSITDLSDRVS